jgi:ADP-ribose pyrophosphatase YjhB (NUDIX family)
MPDDFNAVPAGINSSPDDRRYPAHPIPGVGALIIENGSILLVERGREPQKGYWSLPGGAVEAGEPLETALRREVGEETGLEIEIVHLIEVFERIIPGSDPPSGDAGRPEYHYILLDYICRPAGGKLHASDDASRAAWFTEGEIAGLKITEGTPAVIARAFAWLREADQQGIEARNAPHRH